MISPYTGISSEVKIIYIASANRSGSTLLGKLLGSHPQIYFLGELRNLRAYLTDNRRFFNPVYPLKCACSARVPECPFWRAVLQQAAMQTNVPEFNYRFTLGRVRATEADRVRRKFEKHFFATHPKWFTNRIVQFLMGYHTVSENCFRLYDALAKVSGRNLILDSSKQPNRIDALYKFFPENIRILELYRHPYAVVHSMMKRGLTLAQATENLTRDYEQNRVFLGDIPGNQVLKIRYEDICGDPSFELQKICAFLSIPFHEEILSGAGVGPVHCIGGSPSQFAFDPGRIKDKKEYASELSSNDKQMIYRKTSDAAKKLGYEF